MATSRSIKTYLKRQFSWVKNSVLILYWWRTFSKLGVWNDMKASHRHQLDSTKYESVVKDSTDDSTEIFAPSLLIYVLLILYCLMFIAVFIFLLHDVVTLLPNTICRTCFMTVEVLSVKNHNFLRPIHTVRQRLWMWSMQVNRLHWGSHGATATKTSSHNGLHGDQWRVFTRETVLLQAFSHRLNRPLDTLQRLFSYNWTLCKI